MPQPTVFLGLGSNLGDREANLLDAERELLRVRVPLAEIAPEARHPVLGLSALELLGRCPDESRVTLYRPRETGTA